MVGEHEQMRESGARCPARGSWWGTPTAAETMDYLFWLGNTNRYEKVERGALREAVDGGTPTATKTNKTTPQN